MWGINKYYLYIINLLTIFFILCIILYIFNNMFFNYKYLELFGYVSHIVSNPGNLIRGYNSGYNS